jgi:hypothetical protein
MICRRCLNYIPEDGRFCPKCGVRLRTQVPPTRPWRWIVLVLLCAVIWSRVVRKEFQEQLHHLRAQVNSALNAL